MKSVLKPYAILLLAAVILMTLSVLSSTDGLDIHLHDRYFVLKWSNIYFLLSMAVLSMWLISIGTKNLHSSGTLEWVQIILTILAITILFIPSHYFHRTSGQNTHYTYNDLAVFSNRVTISLVAFILAQLVLLANILMGFTKKWRRKTF